MKIRLRDGVLYAYCKEQNISRDELARRMRVATSTTYRVDQGAVAPSAQFIGAFIRVTGRAFEDLFELDGADAA